MDDEANTDERAEGMIDAARLGRWMDGAGLPGEGEPSVRHLSGGASNEIFEIVWGDRRMALRRPPRNVPKGRNETMLREYRILHALNGTDVPHPNAVAVCDDTDVIGSAFYLMDFVDGWTAMQLPRWPDPFEDDLDARAGLAYELVDGIAKLGNVDWKGQGLEGLGKPDGFHERQVDRWMSQWSGYKFRELPGLDEAAEFLRSYTPSSYRPGIMHGDYQFANVMFEHGGPARLAAIVDFEMGTIGDPLLDLAWVLMSWPNADEDRSVKSYVDYAGMPDREDLLEYYATHSGRPVDEIDYYLVLANFKMAIVLEGGYARVVKGGADNPKMAFFGDVALSNARKAGDLVSRTALRPELNADVTTGGVPVSERSSDVWHVMSTARAIRRFTETPVDDATLDRCLEAATWAPSGANYQRWRFIVLRAAEQRAVVAHAAVLALDVIESVYEMSRPAPDDDSRRARRDRAIYELHDRAGELPSGATQSP